ncbi:hypothetical protein ACFE04_021954 [Oxalis oulophora]
MALQWMILGYIVAAEAAIAILLTLPTPKVIQHRLSSLISLILQPAFFVVPFSAFQLLGYDILLIFSLNGGQGKVDQILCHSFNAYFLFSELCWRWQLLKWRSDMKNWGSVLKNLFVALTYKSQRNVILCVGACILYWAVYRICKYHKEIQSMEEVEKRYKEE